MQTMPHLGSSLPTLPALQTFRHTIIGFGDFPLPPARLLLIHIHLVGCLFSSARFKYRLTAVDRFTRCLEAFPIPNITSETVSRNLLSGWISRFGGPQTITTERARQLKSHLFQILAKMSGTHLSRTTPQHIAFNGFVVEISPHIEVHHLLPLERSVERDPATRPRHSDRLQGESIHSQ